MKNINNLIIKYVLGSLFLLAVVSCNRLNAEEKNNSESAKVKSSESNIIKEYTDIIIFKDNIYAIGSDERIDLFTEEGENVSLHKSDKNKLNCGVANEEIVIVCGDNGTILYSHDGKKFLNALSNTNKSIYGNTYRKGIFYAGSESGEVLISVNGLAWNKIETDAKGNILSLSSNNSLIIGVTDEGEIIKSSDGITWEIKDYNKEYEGYYKFTNFRKIIAIEDKIVIIGNHMDGTPSILFSTSGNIWSEREPIYYDENRILRFLNSKLNGITYDFTNNQFIVVCENGELLSLPACSKCNKYDKIHVNKINAIITYGDNLAFAGSDYSFINKSIMDFKGVLY